MILAFFIAFFSLTALIALLLVTRGYSTSVGELGDLASHTRPVDIEAFRNIIDPAEEDFLRANLSTSQFRAVQRQRLLATAEYVGNVAHNAAVLLRLGQAGLHNPNPTVVTASRQLIENALRLRIYALLSLAKLYLRIAVPEARLSSGRLADNYEQFRSSVSYFALKENPARAARLSAIL